MRGCFITFEGVEGCGKSTQMARLRAWMEEAGLAVLATREPGGTVVGEGIRELLLAPRDEGLGAATELLLYEADRAQHVSEVILPALEAGAHVLCDRFFDSTTAYQAFGRGLDERMVLEMNRMASGGLVPELTLLFSVAIEEGLGRARGRARVIGSRARAWRFTEKCRRASRRWRRASPGVFACWARARLRRCTKRWWPS